MLSGLGWLAVWVIGLWGAMILGGARSWAQPVSGEEPPGSALGLQDHGHSGSTHPFCGSRTDLEERLSEIEWLEERNRRRGGAAVGATATSFEVGDDLVVLVDDGSLSFAGVSDSKAMIRAFFAARYDDFDEIAIYNDFGLRPESGFAFHNTVVNEVTGIGRPVRDLALTFGFPTQRLAGYVNLNSLTRYPTGPFDPVPILSPLTTPVTIFAHEFAHQWLAALQIDQFNILGRGELHWSFYFDVASVMEGNRWRDNNDGTFTTIEAFQRYGELGQYGMGLRPADQVSTQLLVTMHPGGPTRFTFPQIGVTTLGVPHLFEIENVIAQTGERSPGASDAPHSFRVATALVVNEGTMPTAEDLARVARFRVEFEHYFRAETDGRGAVRTRLRVPESRLVHADVPPCPSSRFGWTVLQEDPTGSSREPLRWVAAPKNGAGCIHAYSGRDGRNLWVQSGVKRGDNFGVSMALYPDFTGDQIPELAVGAPGAEVGAVPQSGQVFLLDGASGTVLRAFSSPGSDAGFGRALAVLSDDLDAQGFPDLLVGAPRDDGPAGIDSGTAYLISAETGAVLGRVDGTSPGENLGFSLVVPGDLNGDGREDYLLGAPARTSMTGDARAGAVDAVSGIDGSTLWTAEGSEVSSSFGASLDFLPDVDGDTRPDPVVGEPGVSVRGRPGAGSVHILSGSDGASRWVLPGGGEGAGFGVSIAAVPDLDGDGLFEVAVGSPGSAPGGTTGAGSVALFSTRDGALLDWIEGPRAGATMGASLDAVSVPGGVRLAIGAPGQTPSDPGESFLFDVGFFRLSSRGGGALGSSLELRVSGGSPRERYAIVASSMRSEGLTPLAYPAGSGNAFSLDVGLERRDLTRSIPGLLGRLDGSGETTLQLILPSRATLRGMSFHLQALTHRAAGSAPPRIVRASPALSFTLK